MLPETNERPLEVARSAVARSAKDEMSFAIVADDLTGACDAAVAFTDRGSAVRTGIIGIPERRSQVWAVSTGSRNMSPEAARTELQLAVKNIPSDMRLFKKVDSVFRGNTLDEIHETLATAEFDLAILSPAHPNLGRSMVGGTLYVRNLDRELRVPIAGPLARMGCRCAEIAAGLTVEVAAGKMRSALADGVKVLLLCDAVDAEGLKTAVRAARSVSAHPLWIGSGGLAWALADEFLHRGSEETIERTGNVVYFVGSDHAATLAQQAHLKEMCGSGTGCDALSGCHSVFPVAFGEREDEIRARAYGILPEETGCLFMTGGDTALSVCHALGIRALRLIREFAPGVPLAVAEGGTFEGVPVVLKSGAFGARSLMCDVLEMFRRKEVVA